jgi:hypothetical protein
VSVWICYGEHILIQTLSCGQFGDSIPLITLVGKYRCRPEGEYADGDVHVNTCESDRRASDGGSRRIEPSPKTTSLPTSERFNYGSKSPGNPATKRSKLSSKLRYDATNSPLPMSEREIPAGS